MVLVFVLTVRLSEGGGGVDVCMVCVVVGRLVEVHVVWGCFIVLSLDSLCLIITSFDCVTRDVGG